MARKYYSVFLKAGINGPDREYVNSFAGNWSTGDDAINYCSCVFPEFTKEDFEAEEISAEAFGKDTLAI